MSIEAEKALNYHLNEIVRCFDSGLYYGAIILALTLPDVCSSAEYEEGNEERFRVQKRYESWCSRYVAGPLSVLTAADMWALRGGVMHNGRTFGHPNSRFSRVVFSVPSKIILHGNIQHPSVVELPSFDISVELFLKEMIAAAHRWFQQTLDDPKVIENLENLLHYRPNGYDGHAVGVPVIA